MMSFSDLLLEIKKRPTLYLSRYSIFDFQSFYYGYDLARNQLNLPKTSSEQDFEEFLSWIRSRYNLQTTQSWASLILFHSVDERDALDRLFDLWEKFQNQNKSQALIENNLNSKSHNVEV
jgi:Trp operon repressor